MKKLIILSFLSFVCMYSYAQKVAKVTITTTDSLSTALQKCIEAGKDIEYGSKDLDLKEGKVTLWKHFFGGNDKEQQILITSGTKENKTELTLRMPHLPNTMGSYTKDLKKYVKKLELANIMVGEYFDGIE